ncbi:MAG: MoaD/ThiS family protein [Myxococcota bacterium]
MGLLDSLTRALVGPSIRVHLVIKGRIGEGWYDVDRRVRLAEEATLGDLITRAEKLGIQMTHAIENSPHLRDTLMLNGERCPVDDNLERVLHDGDSVYLLAPLAGG